MNSVRDTGQAQQGDLTGGASEDALEMSFPASDPPALGQASIGSADFSQPSPDDDTQPLSLSGANRIAVLDLPEWTEHLRSRGSISDDGRTSALLLRDEPVRVLLSALDERAELSSDSTDEALLVHVLRGAIDVERDGQEAHVNEQELAAIPPGGGWSIRARQDGTILLSTFWQREGEGMEGSAGTRP